MVTGPFRSDVTDDNTNINNWYSKQIRNHSLARKLSQDGTSIEAREKVNDYGYRPGSIANAANFNQTNIRQDRCDGNRHHGKSPVIGI